MIDDELLKLIDALKATDPYISIIYTEGGCYQFFRFLKTLRPSALPVINADKTHVAALIDGVVYDINGVVTWDYTEIDSVLLDAVKSWGFAKKAMLQIGECPVCEEPLVF